MVAGLTRYLFMHSILMLGYMILRGSTTVLQANDRSSKLKYKDLNGTYLDFKQVIC